MAGWDGGMAGRADLMPCTTAQYPLDLAYTSGTTAVLAWERVPQDCFNARAAVATPWHSCTSGSLLQLCFSPHGFRSLQHTRSRGPPLTATHVRTWQVKLLDVGEGGADGSRSIGEVAEDVVEDAGVRRGC